MSEPASLQLFFSNLVATVGAYEYIFATIELMINCFHIFILSRPRMRISSMNSILLGIALADIFFPLIAIKKKARVWIFGSDECTEPQSLLETSLDWFLYTLRDDFRRCSTWLGLMLAGVRTVAVRNVMNQNYNHISQPAFGWKINFIVLGVSTFFSIFYYFRYEVVNNGTFWTPPATCAQYPAGFRVPNFVLQEREFYKAANGLFRTINLLVVGVLAKFLPCILFPTLTIILTKELKKAVRAREEARKDGAVGKKKEVATRFVIYMTVSFVIIEFPIGICFCIEAASGIYSQGSAASSIIQLLNMVYVVLTLSHFLICFSMSSQYRKTVKQIFSRGPSLQNKAKSVISVVHNRKSQPSSSF
ncbi:G-protein coupled receptors family 1 profile domain-containing protein [Caenorhabditis elegans]|uniref:G-protein coupled receptors family 1 profile domain-containing protein n=1 Tax=Caenorhabditis elegans TaxID=6239 RepID=Q9XU87_CAEEL|nr:G-protein coupled receptors family 1 profile domain-containing protein [Caenorhabditis elegans]CAB05536.1 G-protein coupled receptors family 1 profile domain-containing protein [Caenorhabditis elegans]|eukprot:NP_507129.1 Serpentine Receptor, class W [Caenorhabditis elegans]